MRQQPIKRLEEMRPSPAEAEVLVEQLIKHLEAIKPGPGEAKALVKRMKNGTSSESDRQRLMEILQAEEAALEFLASWNSPSLPSQGHRRAKRKQQTVKRLRRRHRHERRGSEA
jgi:hypothetical protein